MYNNHVHYSQALFLGNELRIWVSIFMLYYYTCILLYIIMYIAQKELEAIALEEISDIGLEDTTDLALKVVKMVVSDDDFQIPFESARRAVNTASLLVEWAVKREANMKLFGDFFCNLMVKFEKCFQPRKSFRVQEEMMWRHYHELRVSDTFKKDWDTFLEQTIDHTASPTFYQFISHRLFQEFIKRRHQIAESNEDCIANPLSGEDETALRYVA